MTRLHNYYIAVDRFRESPVSVLQDKRLHNFPFPVIYAYSPIGKEQYYEKMVTMGVLNSYKKCMDSENLHHRLKKVIGQVQAIERFANMQY